MSCDLAFCGRLPHGFADWSAVCAFGISQSFSLAGSDLGPNVSLRIFEKKMQITKIMQTYSACIANRKTCLAL